MNCLACGTPLADRVGNRKHCDDICRNISNSVNRAYVLMREKGIGFTSDNLDRMITKFSRDKNYYE